jgi:hypothetical protein
MAAAGPALVRERFTRERTADGLLSLYAELAEHAA